MHQHPDTFSRFILIYHVTATTMRLIYMIIVMMNVGDKFAMISLLTVLIANKKIANDSPHISTCMQQDFISIH